MNFEIPGVWVFRAISILNYRLPRSTGTNTVRGKTYNENKAMQIDGLLIRLTGVVIFLACINKYSSFTSKNDCSSLSVWNHYCTVYEIHFEISN